MKIDELNNELNNMGIVTADDMAFWVRVDDETEIEIDLHSVEKRTDGSVFVNFQRVP